jgi:signal transduction histidine kinase
MIDTALSDAERLKTLVKDFLTLSRLESGRLDWSLEVLSLQECVDMAMSNIRARQLKEALPTVAVELPPDLPLVRVDGDWIVEVLAKLLDNGCKFTTPEGSVVISAQIMTLEVVSSLPSETKMLQVTVADTGRGIEPDRLEAVFDRFYQEEGSLRRTVGGTGLGLAICRQILERMGGTIWAESAGRDRGSQFHFTIPIAGEGNPEPEPRERDWLLLDDDELIG